MSSAGPQGSDGADASTPASSDSSSGTGTARRDKPSHGGLLGLLRETVIVVGTALILSLLIKTFLVQAFYIPSESMEQTLVTGDRVLVSELTPGPFELHRGDIVVFRDPGGWLTDVPQPQRGPVASGVVKVLTFVGILPQDAGEHLIKRVIGLPGDHVACCDAQGRVTINGAPLNEPYLAPGAVPSERTFDVVVPAGRVWVMGDNRQNSRDSRWHMDLPGQGTVDEHLIVGRAFVTIWPPSRWTWLSDYKQTFADVPAAEPAHVGAGQP
ncbi:MAG: signal peptidase I [Actinomycetes bacterium]